MMNRFVTGFRINFKKEGVKFRFKGSKGQRFKGKNFVPLNLTKNIEFLNFVSYEISKKG
jgi:hypothetical protein